MEFHYSSGDSAYVSWCEIGYEEWLTRDVSEGYYIAGMYYRLDLKDIASIGFNFLPYNRGEMI